MRAILAASSGSDEQAAAPQRRERRGLKGGALLVLALALGAGIGSWLDRRLDCAPTATAILAGAFIAVGLWWVARDAA